MKSRSREEAMLSLLQWKATVAGLKHQALLFSGKFLEALRMLFRVLSPQKGAQLSQSSLMRLATAQSMFFSRRISSCSSLATDETLQRKMLTSFCIYRQGCLEQAMHQSMMLYFMAGKEKFSQQARLQKQIMTLTNTFLLKAGHCPNFDYIKGMAGRQEVSTWSRFSAFDMMFSATIESPPKETQKTYSILQMASSPMDQASSLVRYSRSFEYMADPFKREEMAEKQCS